jgi:acyl-coenzyme A thioesterase PaaI-like protein
MRLVSPRPKAIRRALTRRISRWIDAHLATLMTLYPPYLGAGVRIDHLSAEEVRVHMVLRSWNKNYVNTQFGGSLYSMCDPFFMLMMMRQLGADYIVWDKAATIRFRRPGRGTVRATFTLPAEEVARVRALADAQPSVEVTYTVEVRDDAGELIASVDKLIYIKKK